MKYSYCLLMALMCPAYQVLVPQAMLFARNQSLMFSHAA
jgi:hypothetical protein